MRPLSPRQTRHTCVVSAVVSSNAHATCSRPLSGHPAAMPTLLSSSNMQVQSMLGLASHSSYAYIRMNKPKASCKQDAQPHQHTVIARVLQPCSNWRAPAVLPKSNPTHTPRWEGDQQTNNAIACLDQDSTENAATIIVETLLSIVLWYQFLMSI
jgi:hypothetical protein